MPKIKRPDGGTSWATSAGAAVLAARRTSCSAVTVERPDPYATRGEWDEYARHIGLDPSGFSSKTALIEAIEGGE